MHSALQLWSCALLVATAVAAATGDQAAKHPYPRNMEKSDALFSGFSTSSTTRSAHLTVSFLDISSSTTSLSFISRTPFSTSPRRTTTPLAPIAKNLTIISKSTLTDLPPSTLSASQVSAACIETTDTYTGSVPPTVYLTVTEGYEVTLSAPNASLTAPPLLITPASACFHTVSPMILKTASLAAPACIGRCPQLNTVAPQDTPAPLTGSAYTSTVYVTKKTPVPVIQQTSTPPPVFQLPTKSTRPVTPSPNNSPVNTAHPISPGGNGGGSAAPNNIHTSSPSLNTKLPASQPGQNVQSVKPVSIAPATAPGTKSSKAPGVPSRNVPQTTQRNAVTTNPPAEKTSKVVIGGQVISIPTGKVGTTVLVDGQTYTIKSSEIIGPHTTIPIEPTASNAPAPKLVPETVAGLTFSVGSTKAVIAGTTYAIGPGAKATTIVVSGETISIGKNGVGFASTTVLPVTTGRSGTGTPSVITVGGLTFSVGKTEAILSGTTYKLGSGASTRTTVIDGHTISVGPSGVGVVSKTAASSTGKATSSAATGSASGSAALQTTNGASRSCNHGAIGMLVLLAASFAMYLYQG